MKRYWNAFVDSIFFALIVSFILLALIILAALIILPFISTIFAIFAKWFLFYYDQYLAWLESLKAAF